MGGVKKNTKIRTLFVMMLATVLIILRSVQVNAADVTVLETNVSVASEDNVLVGVPGTFYSTSENEMLDLMNKVRKEAYDEQLEYPKGSGKHLGVDYAYVPLKWSSKLEQIARIRAVEVCLLAGHSRPSGKSTFLSIDEFSSNEEVIAWNTNVLNGIKNESNPDDSGSWYGEKKYFVDSAISQDSTQYVQGHYIAMIDPNNKYVGISGFKGSYGVGYLNQFQNIVGEFSSTSSSLDQTFNGWHGEYIHKVEVKAGYVTMGINGENVLHIGDEKQFKLNASVNIGSYGSDNCTMYTDAAWTSSDPGILSVNNHTGRVTAVSSGQVTLTATITTGSNTLKATQEVIVLPDGVEIGKLNNPSVIEVNTGTKPNLPETVKATLTNGETIYVHVTWEDMESGYYSTKSYNYYRDTSFDVIGTFQEHTVKQTVKVIAMIDHFVLEKDTITVDSGTKPVYPKAEKVYLTNGMFYNDITLTWADGEVYKKREGGTYEIEGQWASNKTKKTSVTLVVNPATVDKVIFDENPISTMCGTEPIYPKATVIWSNGDVEKEDIEWEETEDFKTAYKSHEGGSYTINGTWGGQSTTVTVNVKPVIVPETKNESAEESQRLEDGKGDDPEAVQQNDNESFGTDGGNKSESVIADNITDTNTGGTNTTDTNTTGTNTAGNSSNDQEAAQPATTTVIKLVPKKKAITVKWKKTADDVSGYQIQYSTKKNFKKNTKMITVSKRNASSKTIKKLKSNNRYYVRIRTYKKNGNKKVYSSWSKVITVKAK